MDHWAQFGQGVCCEAHVDAYGQGLHPEAMLMSVNSVKLVSLHSGDGKSLLSWWLLAQIQKEIDSSSLEGMATNNLTMLQ